MGLGGFDGGGLLDGSRWCPGWLCHGLRLVVGLWWLTGWGWLRMWVKVG